MQAPPALSLSVSRFGVWRGLCLTAVLAAVAAATTWGGARFGFAPQALLLPAFALCLSAALLRAPTPFHLRWDTQCWHLGGQPGALSVAVDAGGCLLLRFVPHAGRGVRWLPVQRAGHETAWHALRCTLYCARLPAHGPAADL